MGKYRVWWKEPRRAAMRARAPWIPGAAGGDQAKTVSDTASASDALAIAVSLALTDTGAGADAFSGEASVPLADTGAGADAFSVIQATLIAIADAAAGSDAVGIAVQVQLSDAGAAAELLAITALLQVLEQGSGMDVAVRFDSQVRIATITFVKRSRSVSFSMARRRIDFSLN